MKYCGNCGHELEENSKFCPSCGAKVGDTTNPYQPTDANSDAHHSNDAPSTGFAILGFFFPLIGLILYLVWKDESPLKAKSCGKGALIGVIVNFVVGVCGGIALAIAEGMAGGFY